MDKKINLPFLLVCIATVFIGFSVGVALVTKAYILIGMAAGFMATVNGILYFVLRYLKARKK